MLGILDSGRGGLLTLNMLRRFFKGEDILLLMDKENLPYGRRSLGELTDIVSDRLTLLRELGARRAVIGCCTASATYPYLDRELRQFAIPIVEPTARRALSLSENGRIALLATESTVAFGAFDRALDCLSLTSVSASPLVRAVEDGEDDLGVSPDTLAYCRELIDRASAHGADTLILGCTHFPALERRLRELGRERGIRHTVSSVREGALTALNAVGEERREEGRDLILSTPIDQNQLRFMHLPRGRG